MTGGERCKSPQRSAATSELRFRHVGRGVVVDQEDWDRLAERLRKANVNFHTEPQTVFPGQVKEQSIMLIHDGCGNIVEFKASPKYGLFQREK